MTKWMIKIIVTVFLPALICLTATAGDSTRYVRPSFFAFSINEGFVMPTKKILSKGEYNAPHTTAFTLKYGLRARGDSWRDRVFGMPYKGIGVYVPRFSMQKELGDPFSVFLFQGAKIADVGKDVSFNYEINLGASFNWRHYDTYDNPKFIVFGSSANIHLAGSWYFKWRLSNRFDIHTGLSLTHFSNGALRTPNNGLNTLSAFVEVAYKLQEERTEPSAITFPAPPFKKGTQHDLSILFSTKTLKVDIDDTGLKCRYPEQRFKVAGLSYAYLFHTKRRFKWGPGIDLVYDESVNAQFKGETDLHTGQYREYCKLAKAADRFSAGLSLKGEISMPGYSIFATLGYDIYHKDHREKRFYQIYGLKLYLIDNLFATFGVRSTDITHSQYLYFNLGYSFGGN